MRTDCETQIQPLQNLRNRYFDDPVWAKIVKLGLPSLGSVLLSPIYSATDSAIMGHVGEIPLAALALAMGFINFWVLPFTSVGFAITSRAASYVGKESSVARNELGMSSCVTMGLFGLSLGILFAALAPFVTPFLTHSVPVARSATEYLQLAAIGLPALFAFQAGSMFLTGSGRTSIVLGITTLNVGVNIALELVLVFGAHLSVAGSAIGTDIAEIIGAGVIIWIIRYPGALTSLGHNISTFAKEFLSAGLVLTIRTFALVGALSGSVFVASLSTPTVLDSFQLGQQIWLVFGLSFDAVAVPAQVLVGEWLSRGQLKEMKHWTSRMLHIGWIGGFGLAICLIAARGALVGMFTNIPSIAQPARESVAFAGLTMPITAVSFVIDGLVGGLQRFKTLRTIMLVSLAIALIFLVAMVLVVGKQLSVADVWIVFGAWLVARCITSLIAWKKLLAIHT